MRVSMFRRRFASVRDALGTAAALIAIVSLGFAVYEVIVAWARWVSDSVWGFLFRVEPVPLWVWPVEVVVFLALIVSVLFFARRIWDKGRAVVNESELVFRIPLGLTGQERRLIEAMRVEPDSRPLDLAFAAYVRSEFRRLRGRDREILGWLSRIEALFEGEGEDEEIMRRLSRIESLLEKEDDEITRRLIAIEAAVCTERLVLEPETAHEQVSD